MNRLLTFIGILAILFLSGCGTPLYLKTGPVEAIKNQDDNLAASYMARYLMPAKERHALLKRVGEKIEQQKSSPTATTSAGFFGAVALGQNPLSQQGLGTAGNISLGLDIGLGIINMLGPDGSLKHVGNIYLPAEYNDHKIDSACQAFNVARQYTINRIYEVAKMEDRQIECLLNCGEVGSPVFKLTKNGMSGDEEYDHGKLVSDDDGYYDPPSLYIITAFGELKEAEPDPLREAILGFPVAWEGAWPNSWQVHIGGEIKTDSGQVATADTKSFGIIAANWKYPGYTTPLGRRILRHLTGGPSYITWGNGKTLTKQFCMNGRVFTYPYITNKKFIDKELLVAR